MEPYNKNEALTDMEELVNSGLLPDFNTYCTNAVMLNEKVQQLPYTTKTGSFVCKCCAETCRKDQKQPCEETKVFYLHFKCQCEFLPGGCQRSLKTLQSDERYQEHMIDDSQKEELRDYFKRQLKKQLESLIYREIPLNPLAQQQFEFRFESYIEGAHLYKDEMTQMIAISCIPEEIQSMGVYGLPAAEWPVGNQVKQIKALLHWFKNDFFSWCDSPPCP